MNHTIIDTIVESGIQHHKDIPATLNTPAYQEIVKLIPHTLSPGQSISAILDKPKNVVPIEKLERNLDHTIKEWEQNIEDQINQKRLEAGLTPIEKKKPLSKEEFESAVEFLERVLPRSILQNPDLAISAKIYIRVEWGAALMQSLESGFSVLSLIYKAKILKAARKMLTDLKIIYKKSPKKIGENIFKSIKEWEVNLREQEESLKINSWKYGVLITGYLSTATEKVFRFLPLGMSKTAPMLGSFASVFAIIFGGFSFYQRWEASKVFQAWVNNYNQWQAKLAPTFEKPVESGALFKRKHVYKAEIENVINNNDINKIRQFFRQHNISLPSNIKSQTELLKNWKSDPEFKKNLLSQYVDYNNTLLNLKNIAEKSKNLLQKREARVALKVIKLRSNIQHEIENNRPFLKFATDKLSSKYIKQFDQLLEMKYQANFNEMMEKVNELQIPVFEGITNKEELVKFLTVIRNDKVQLLRVFKEWVITNPDENFLKTYIDHQETINIAVKQNIKTIITAKMALEKKFFDFSLSFAKSYFYTVLLTLSIAIVIGLLLAYASPLLVGLGISVGAAQIALYLLSFSGIALTVGFLIRGYQMGVKYKPQGATMLETVKLSFKSINATIMEEEHLYKQRKFFKISKLLYSLHQGDKNYAKAKIAYHAAKKEFEKSEEKFENWLVTVNQLEENLTQRAWEDFSKFAQIPSDSLNTLKEALKSCDLSLLDDETRTLLTQQLGINFEALQEYVDQAPDFMIRGIRNFIGFDEERLKVFIKHQNDLYNNS